MKTGLILGNSAGTVTRIRPHKNYWAYDMYCKSQANSWVPNDIQMGEDIEQWRQNDLLSADERLLLRRCLGFFAGSESLVANNLALSLIRCVKDPECLQYIARQIYEESLHNQTIVYICDSLGLDEDEIYGAYQSIPSIKAKDDFLASVTIDLASLKVLPHDHPNTSERVENHQKVLRNIITFYIICEGIFFYSGFVMLLSFKRRNRMKGIARQVQYTLRDESMHVSFGTKLINKIVEQEPLLWTPAFKEETLQQVRQAVELEVAYARDVLPRPILGLSSDSFILYMSYIANRRLKDIGLPEQFRDVRNPFGWMSEVIDLAKSQNFFEGEVTEYSTGTLRDDMTW